MAKYSGNIRKYRNPATCLECGTTLKSNYALRCKSCNGKVNNSMKGRSGELNPNWKGGKLRCLDCGKETSSRLYKRCKSCAAIKFINKPGFKKGLIERATGSNNPMYGKKHKDTSKRKMSLKAGGNGTPYDYGEYGPEFNDKLKEKIRSRDNYTCQLCGITQEEYLIINGFSLSVHHIDYDKKNNRENNLISLCNQCHSRTNYNRNYWENKLCHLTSARLGM